MQSRVAGGTQAGLAALRLQSSADSASSLGSGSWLTLWPVQHGVGLRHGAPPWGLRQAALHGPGARRRRCRRPATVSMLMRPVSGAPVRLSAPRPRGGALVAHAVEQDDAAEVAAGRRLVIAKSERDDPEREREKAHRASAASAVRARGFGAAADSAKKAGERRQQRKPRQRQPVRPSTAASALLPVPVRPQPAEPFLLPLVLTRSQAAGVACQGEPGEGEAAGGEAAEQAASAGQADPGDVVGGMLPGLAELVVLEMLTEVRPRRAWLSCSRACATSLLPSLCREQGVAAGARASSMLSSWSGSHGLCKVVECHSDTLA